MVDSVNRRPLRFEPLEDRRVLAVLTVTTPLDVIDFNDGRLSLREAIFIANSVPGLDTIDFDFGHDGPETVVLTQGELRITDSLTIHGPAAHLLAIDARGSDPTPDVNDGRGMRIFNIDDGSALSWINVDISGVTLTGGDVTGRGGAILSRGIVSIRDSVIEANSAVGTIASGGAVGDEDAFSHGGGISQRGGRLTLLNSIVSNNSADFGAGIHLDGGELEATAAQIVGNVAQSGAGFYNDNGNATVRRSSIRDNSAPGVFSLGGGVYTSGNLTIAATTISGNSAAFGAGVFSRTAADGSEITHITNSTISGNTAVVRGGGVRNAFGNTTIEYSTITANHAPPGQGSGVASRGYDTSWTIVRHTIIAGNANSDVDFVTGGLNTFQSGGYNLIGVGNAVSAFSVPLDRTGITNPLLGPLADNGGPTQTHALLSGSPAINAGDPAAVAGMDGVPMHDQRGVPLPRVYGGRIDIGAFELQPTNVIPGDANRDGMVDIADYVLWRKQMGTNVAPGTGADANGDGVVDHADLELWRSNFGYSAAPGGIAAAASFASGPATAALTASHVEVEAGAALPLVPGESGTVGRWQRLVQPRERQRGWSDRVDRFVLREEALIAWALSRAEADRGHDRDGARERVLDDDLYQAADISFEERDTVFDSLS